MINKITIKDFKISAFYNLLKESLKTNNSTLMLQVRDGMIKSASFSKTKSLIKLWQSPISNLINSVDELDDSISKSYIEELDSLDFDFYILKGDLFMKFLEVFSDSSVSLEFTIEEKQAKSLKITGQTSTKYFIETTFPLTNEEMITNKVEDYKEIINQCTPSADMVEFLITKNYIQEIKKLVKNLHQVSVDNSAYLNFKVTEHNINVSDKVFDIDLPNIQHKKFTEGLEISFNMLKSDFVLPGEHNFTISTNNDSQKVIMNGIVPNAIICCLCTKVGNNQITIDDDDDDVLNSFNPANYDFDDL